MRLYQESHYIKKYCLAGNQTAQPGARELMVSRPVSLGRLRPQTDSGSPLEQVLRSGSECLPSRKEIHPSLFTASLRPPIIAASILSGWHIRCGFAVFGVLTWVLNPCKMAGLMSVEGYPSGQRGQTVNLLALPSEVRILPPPPLKTDFLSFCWAYY